MFNSFVYTPLINRALRLSYEVHEGHFDRAGTPYVFHPYTVACMVPQEEPYIVAALLHDCMEENPDCTAEYLRAKGIPEDTIEVVSLLTHDLKTSYKEYIEKLSSNRVARMVKMADLEHNMNVTRFDDSEGIKHHLLEKYYAAYNLLSQVQKKEDQGC